MSMPRPQPDRVHAKARPVSASIGNVWSLGRIDGNG
jgi:hypothetical protein